MTIQRMQDVKESLEAAGWSILNETGDNRYCPNLFKPLDETFGDMICWGIRRNSDKLELELEFHMHGRGALQSRKPQDIFYCSEPDRNIQLFFEKRTSKEWPRAISNFIRELEQIEGHDDRSGSMGKA